MKRIFKENYYFYRNTKTKTILSLSLTFLMIIIFNLIGLSVASQDIDVNSKEITPKLSQQQSIYLAKFFEPGCHDCERAEQLLNQIAFEYPELEVRKFDMTTPEGVALAEELGKLYGVPEYDRLLVPMIYLGDEYLLRDQVTYENVVDVIEKIKGESYPPPWELVEETQDSVQQRIIERFQSFGIGAVAISGLIDGINPCAFATIIFFISYLALINRTGEELLLVGSMFTLAIFLTYFFIGAGTLRIVTTLSFLPLARQIFIYVTAAIGLILGTLSLMDYLKYKKTGKTSDTSLQLPPKIKQMIHSTIRKNVKTRNFVIMAAVSGFMVSILELACTGQIYLPTLIFISNIPELRGNALIYLLVYNFMFVVPLIIVFLFTYWGTSSQKWAELNKKHFGTVKLIMTVLFFNLAILLIMTGLLF